jgi:hypothetical protein
MMRELKRFWADESGDLPDTVIAIALLVVVGGTALKGALDILAHYAPGNPGTGTGAIYAVIEFVRSLVPPE